MTLSGAFVGKKTHQDDRIMKSFAPEQIEHQCPEMLARWVASENACSGAYAISRRYEQAGAIYYEGTCK
jgi:hypothetical protein